MVDSKPELVKYNYQT